MTAIRDPRFQHITVWPCDRIPGIAIRPAPAPPDDPAVERAWARMTAANPRLFDGPILSPADFDPVAPALTCVRESYKRLSVQDEAPTGVTLVAVNGVVTARDSAGREHVLLGRRAPNTRMYGGQWELAPAGGLDPPPDAVAVIEPSELLAQLNREMVEETGITDPLTSVSPVACYGDSRARSFNIVLRASLSRPIESLNPGERDWDCDATMWLPLDDIPRFDRQRRDIIDATRALWRTLGWLSSP